ncbi:hypothetical protein B0H14DRAFT_3663870 [Mycena olivaceomarginata]|nr:hypothetical protein B0H14DRAFT_3663870 [Mycena olivaceomarginata]
MGKSCEMQGNATIPITADPLFPPPSMPCKTYYTAKKNDSCAEISVMFNISSSDFWTWNPWVQNPYCSVFEGLSYCVGTNHTCGQTTIVGPLDNCTTVDDKTQKEGGWGNLTDRNPQIATPINIIGSCDDVLDLYRNSSAIILIGVAILTQSLKNRTIWVLHPESREDRDYWPEALKRPTGEPDPTWDLGFLRELAKENNGMRTWQKSQQIAKVLNAFAAKYGLDPVFMADLVHEQFLSDEAEESKEAWKVRLAAPAKLRLDPGALKNEEFLEILVPTWRSHGYSSLIHDMEPFKLDDTNPDLKHTRVGMSRISDRIPRFAPYTFGISMQWFEKNYRACKSKATQGLE